jgi:hypothetical protein
MIGSRLTFRYAEHSALSSAVEYDGPLEEEALDFILLVVRRGGLAIGSLEAGCMCRLGSGNTNCWDAVWLGQA